MRFARGPKSSALLAYGGGRTVTTGIAELAERWRKWHRRACGGAFLVNSASGLPRSDAPKGLSPGRLSGSDATGDGIVYA